MDVDSSTEGNARSEGWERRRLGLGSASALVVASMIGAGVFTTSGFALGDLGRPEYVLYAWLLGGAIALCGALSYGGLAQRIPVSGGEYTYLGRVVHPMLGYMAGWVSLFAGFTGPTAAAALALEAYLGSATGLVFASGVTGAGVIALAAAVHALRPALGAVSLNALVVLKAVVLLAFLGWGAASIDALPVSPAGEFDLGAFAVTLVWVSFSYSGWNGAVYLAGEIRDPERNLRRALWVPTLGVAALYVATNAVFVWSGPVEALAGRPDVGAAAAALLGGPVAERVVAGVICLALLTSISVMVLSGPRVIAQMSRDGLLPRILARGDEAPALALALQALLAIAIVYLSDLAQLIGTLGFTLSLSAATTVGVAAVLRHREGPEAVPIPGYPWVPAVFIVFTLGSAGFLVVRNPGDAAIGVCLLLLGIPAYLLRRRH